VQPWAATWYTRQVQFKPGDIVKSSYGHPIFDGSPSNDHDHGNMSAFMNCYFNFGLVIGNDFNSGERVVYVIDSSTNRIGWIFETNLKLITT
jgi:hypothetical protein